jgi:ectoine hydroxylase
MSPVSNRYASRTEHEAGIITRREPVVYPHDELPVGRGLDATQLSNYERDGFIVLEGFFSPAEVAVLRGELARMISDPSMRRREEAIQEPDGPAVRSIFSIHTLSSLYARLARDRRLLDIVGQILGSRAYIHQSRANLKPGFSGKEFYWHSDFETWHVEDGMPSMRAVSCSITLTDNTEYNGPLMIMPGSQRQFISCVGKTPDRHYLDSLRSQRYGVPDEVNLRLLADQGGIVPVKGKAGSVLFFDCNVMHGSNGNISPDPRSNLFFVYNSIENTVGDPQHGLTPRPEFVATRKAFAALEPIEPDEYLRLPEEAVA